MTKNYIADWWIGRALLRPLGFFGTSHRCNQWTIVIFHGRWLQDQRVSRRLRMHVAHIHFSFFIFHFATSEEPLLHYYHHCFRRQPRIKTDHPSKAYISNHNEIRIGGVELRFHRRVPPRLARLSYTILSLFFPEQYVYLVCWWFPARLNYD